MNYPICPTCKVIVPVDTSKRTGETQVRWHRCKCGYSATREVPRRDVFARTPGQRKRLDTA